MAFHMLAWEQSITQKIPQMFLRGRIALQIEISFGSYAKSFLFFLGIAYRLEISWRSMKLRIGKNSDQQRPIPRPSDR
jgi:hypothetical protein